MSEPFLEIEGLTKQFGGLRAVNKKDVTTVLKKRIISKRL